MNDNKISELHRLAEIGKLSGGFIHDLANHITMMSLSLDRVEESLLRDQEQIREHAAESARVRKNIKYFVEAMRKHIRGNDIPCYFSIEKKLRELVTLFKYKAEKEHVTINVSVDISIRNSGKCLRLYGSRVRFNQLFSNLISNAIDSFGLSEGVKKRHVSIKIKKKSVKGVDHAVISVEDNGLGIDPKNKDRIFETFFTTKKDGKGVGLGLATVKEIVEKDFSGSISFTSTPGKGTTFSAYLPLRSLTKLTGPSRPNPNKLS